MKISKIIYLIVLLIINLIVIVDYVYLQHKTRKQFVALQALIEQERVLDAEWGKLQLEHSTLVNNSRIELMAKTKLGMKIPDNQHVISINR